MKNIFCKKGLRVMMILMVLLMVFLTAYVLFDGSSMNRTIKIIGSSFCILTTLYVLIYGIVNGKF